MSSALLILMVSATSLLSFAVGALCVFHLKVLPMHEEMEEILMEAIQTKLKYLKSLADLDELKKTSAIISPIQMKK